MKLLYGTGNQAKLAAMRSRLRQIGIELVGLNDLKADGLDIPKWKMAILRLKMHD